MDLASFWAAIDAVPVADDAEALYQPDPAGRRRRANLERYLQLLMEQGTDTMLLAEAPGWRGMTNTGIPFMSVRELTARPGMVTGAVDGDGFAAPPEPTALWEASSRVVWAALASWTGPLPVSWPVFPHHPFVDGNRLSNRTPRPSEVRSGADAVGALAAALGIERFIAVGRKAEGALVAAGIAAIAIRHPAQGGTRQFTEQLAALNTPPDDQKGR
ncbi:hypothetical protein [Curtobacterium ammoniigenes]|uniref:hypothetical protein n=1 Tax=Curtobacterium ammoniigenes TaxID=395387 RepID=UPI000831FFD0|nr:hypothetical protein [Curtobacterium ammoniigenes]